MITRSIIATIAIILALVGCAALAERLSTQQSIPTRNYYISWNNKGTIGNYALAPGLTNIDVFIPNGSAPAQADLSSQRYNHHTRVKSFGSRIWVAHSSGGTNEDAGGQMCVVHSSADGWNTQTGPVAVLTPQSTYSGTGATDTIGTYISYPRHFVVYQNNLYIVCAVDSIAATGPQQLGLALIAALCNSDGTIGTPFQISVAAYSPLVGSPYIYDPTLGPPILALANLYGMWGGSYPAQPASEWIGWIQQGSGFYAEPDTIDIGGTALVRLWRPVTGVSTTFQWEQISNDGGVTWTELRQTNIPQAPSPTSGIRLSDGRILFAGNPVNQAVTRDPLYLAIVADPNVGVSKLYAVRQGLSGVPVYAGTSKGGGAQYSGIDTDGTNIWISYSVAKENIGLTKIPISGL